MWCLYYRLPAGGKLANAGILQGTDVARQCVGMLTGAALRIILPSFLLLGVTENGKLVVIIGLVLTNAVILFIPGFNKKSEPRMPHNGLFHTIRFCSMRQWIKKN